MSRPIIEIDGVSKRLGPVQVLRELSFEVGPGEKLALIGPSGSGKTTILRILMTLETIDDGHIKVDAEHKNELDPALVAQADRYVADRRAQCAALGELHHAIAAGAVAADIEVPELGEVIAGKTAGRTRDDQITVADLTGTGVQDTAIATLARARAEAAGTGTNFDS